MNISYRLIKKQDNKELASVIRSVLREFKIDQPGTVYTDPTTDRLFELFQAPQSIYWIAEEDGKILGGCGIYPTQGLPEGCGELVKLYLSTEARGKGIGKHLMHKCFASAIKMGYQQLYLESLPELDKAIGIYLKEGFVQIQAPLGDSGHYACNIWMLKKL